MDILSQRLGHRFADDRLLVEALTHPSLEAGGRPGRDYDRLEFLGDRVLGLVIAEALWRRFPAADAGELARRYNTLVRRETLAQVAEGLALGSHLRLSRSERAAGGAAKPAILANACEAVIGAVFLDGGFDAARRLVLERWTGLLEQALGDAKDAKTALQEWAHAAGQPGPDYVLTGQSGPPHDPRFSVAVHVGTFAPATGAGKSKREAETAAAAAMLGLLQPGWNGRE